MALRNGAVQSRRQPRPAAAEFASHIVHAYVQSYVDMKYSGDVTQAALDLAQIGRAQDGVGPLRRRTVRTAAGATQVWKAQRRTKRFWHNTLVDIGSFGSQIKRATRDAAVQQGADEVAAALRRARATSSLPKRTTVPAYRPAQA